MRTDLTFFDGLKAIPISSYPEEAWRTVLGSAGAGMGDLTPQAAYATVPVVFRAIDLRAKAVATMPYGLYAGGRDVSDDPAVRPYHRVLTRLLLHLEASYCLFGAAYALKEAGALSGDPMLRWVATPGMTPEYDERRGVLGFTRAVGRGRITYRPGQVLHVWAPNLEHDIGPGPGPGKVALASAGVLTHLDAYLQYYFKRGAIKAYLIKVKGAPRREDREKIKSAWGRMLAGIQNVFKAEVFSDDVSFEPVGDALAETANPELRQQAVQDALIALGVPASLVLANAANYATAQQDDLHFYTKTIVPQAELFAHVLNEQYFDDLGLTYTLHPERLEVMQRSELEQAEALAALTGNKPILTVDEARAWLGLGPMPATLAPPLNLDAPAVHAWPADLDAPPVHAWPADLDAGWDDAAEESFWAEEAATDYCVEDAAVKRARGRRVGAWNPNNHPRGPDGRFIRTPGADARQRERDAVRTGLAAERQQLRAAQQAARDALMARLVPAPGERPQDVQLRRAAARRDLVIAQRAERAALVARHTDIRLQLRARHDQERVAEMAAMMAARREESPRALTRAYGNNPNRSYELRHRLVDMDEIQASNLPSGAINPAYDPRLQPRDRSRSASHAQIDAVARNLNPDVVTMDFHRIDAGSPIVDAAGNVLSGNGRTLALQRAAELHPDRYRAYRDALRARADELGIDRAAIDRMRRPMLVRELIGAEDPAAFAREANTSQTLRMSPLEQARVDATVLRDRDVLRLTVDQEQGIDAALRDRANRPFVDAFLATVPDNERATLLTRDGSLNQMGLYRMKAALYARVFPGDAGERMAESMLESLDPSLRNVQNGIAASLPALARAQALIASGQRDAELDLAEDLARAIDVLARIKDNPALTANTPADQLVAKYLAQSTLFERELTPDQERLLVHIDRIARRPTAIRDLMQRYADMVESAAQTGQGDLFGGAGRLTRAELLERLLGSQREAPQTQGGLWG